MATARKFIEQNCGLVLRDAMALWLAISKRDEIPVRQLLREFESSYPAGYGKQVTVKTLALLGAEDKEWLCDLY